MRRTAQSEAQQKQQHQAVRGGQPKQQQQQQQQSLPATNRRQQQQQGGSSAVGATGQQQQGSSTRRQAVLGEQPQQHQLYLPSSSSNKRHQAVPGGGGSPLPPPSSPIHRQRPSIVGKGGTSPTRRQAVPSAPSSSSSPNRQQQGARRRSSAVAANGVNNTTAGGTKMPPKVTKLSPSPSVSRRRHNNNSSSTSPSVTRRYNNSNEYLSQQQQHRGSVASSVAAFAAVLAAAPTSSLRRNSNSDQSLLRSRQRPLAVPNVPPSHATTSQQQQQQFLSVPDPSASGARGGTWAMSSSPPSSVASTSASPMLQQHRSTAAMGGGWVSQPASPMMPRERPSSLLLPPPPLFSAGSCSPLPTTNHYHGNGNDDDQQDAAIQQRRRRQQHAAAVRSEPNVCGSGKQQQQQSMLPFLRSLRQLKLFKRRSASELSLVLELLRNVGGGGDDSNGAMLNGCAEDADGYDSSALTDDEQQQMKASDDGGLSARHRNRHNASQRYRHRTASPVPAATGSVERIQRHHTTVRRTATTLSRRTTQRSQQRRTRRRFPWGHYSPAAIQRRFMNVQEEKAMLQAPTAPIDASKFVAYVQERRKKRILFKGEFLMIQRSVDPQRCTTEVGVRMGERNQYPDTLPYDHNRVVLELRPGVDDSHYINASYVNSWIREKAYVVTQSVRSKQASNEMWRTVWELGSNTMVMLTKIFDFMRVMCLQYWPQTHFQFGEIHVETLETRTYAHFVIRTFRLRKTGGPGGMNGPAANANGDGTADSAEEERIVKHFHFTEWELNSFPYISAFVELRRRVRQWMEKSPVDAPIVVHCSNGGGRSGAFLALDANLELLQRTGQLDVYEYGRTLANSRQHLIDTVDQYIFIYDVLCEAVLCNIQPIGMHQLKNRSGMYKARKDRALMEVQDSHENKLLLMLTAPLRIGDCAGGHRLENRGKNRDVMVVPPDHSRPYLQTLHGESKDYTYINAVEVDGFTRKSEFIVTEWPKVPTLDSFWTLIFDHNVHTVISLTNQPSDVKQFPQFVHNKGKRNYGPFTVEVVNYQQYPGLQSHMVKISKRPTDPVPINSQPNPDKGANKKLTFMISEIMASGANQQQLEAEVRLCCIIQVKMWPIENKVPLSTTALIEVLKMTRSWRKRAPDRPEQRPTIVMSHNGVSRCGIFIAANVCIDQMEMDHEVDVFHAVKLIRLNRPQLIDMKDEYKYLYDLMLHWYMTSPELRQFEPLEMSNSEPDDDERSEDGASLGAATARGTRSRSGSAARRRRGSSRHDGHSLARSKSTRASLRHANTTGANSAIQRVPTGAGRDNANSLAVSGGAQMLARNASSMSAGTAMGGGSRKRETIYLN